MLWPGLLTGTHLRPKVSNKGMGPVVLKLGDLRSRQVAWSGDPATTAFIYAPVIWLHDTTMLEEPPEEHAELRVL